MGNQFPEDFVAYSDLPAGVSERIGHAAQVRVDSATGERVAWFHRSTVEKLVADPKLTNEGRVSRSAFMRGDDERHIVDSYLGDGAYDNEFTTDAEIDEALGG